MNNSQDGVMPVKQVADYLRVDQRTVYRLAVERRLPGFKVGANQAFTKGCIDKQIAAKSSAETLVGEVVAKRADKKV